MSYNVMLEGLISDMGGCGRFQWILSSLMHLSKTIAAWSMLHMSFIGQEPKFFCESQSQYPSGTVYDTTYNVSERSCSSVNNSECMGYRFEDEMHTVVSEWDLVCDRKWIVATITTIQMGGVLTGNFVAGHLGDWIGRKPTYFLALLILIVFNVVAYFSLSWEMYAAARFMLGAGVGFVISVIYNQMSEFTTSIWRPVILGVPSWASEASIFALVCWLLKDWKNIHLASAIVGVPFLLSWWFNQESFRWLITKGRYEDAEAVVERVARINGYDKPDLSHIISQVKLEENSETTRKRYSAIDLFRTKKGAIRTSALLFIWMGASYAYYGLTFGVQFMKGNLYLNMFIINAVEIPGNLFAIFCMNKIGRKWTCIVGLVFTGLCGIGDGVLQYVDTPAKDVLINVFAVGSRLGNDLGWGALAVMTMEMHPTVIRATAYGVTNTAARVGGMIAPQIVFLNDEVPGLLFFLNAGIMFISALLCLMFEDTKDHVLEDALHKQDAKPNSLKQTTAIIENGLSVTGNERVEDKHELYDPVDLRMIHTDTKL